MVSNSLPLLENKPVLESAHETPSNKCIDNKDRSSSLKKKLLAQSGDKSVLNIMPRLNGLHDAIISLDDNEENQEFEVGPSLLFERLMKHVIVNKQVKAQEIQIK